MLGTQQTEIGVSNHNPGIHCEHYRQASACSCDSRGLLLVHFDCMASIFFRIETRNTWEYTLECIARIFKMIIVLKCNNHHN